MTSPSATTPAPADETPQLQPPPAVRELAATAVRAEIGSATLGEYLGAVAEDAVAITVFFAATERGYRGWRWSATVALLDPDAPTVSEVVLLPGAESLLAPAWVPWDQRLRPGDLGVGDLLLPAADDPRLVPGYLASDDPEVERVAQEVGFGRVRVLSLEGRIDAAERWHDGQFGPQAEMALAAPGHCVSCGFYLPLAGSLGAGFGACGNDVSPADGRVVDSGYGCGAHSEAVADIPPRSAASAIVIDEVALEVHQRPDVVDAAVPAEVEAESVEAGVVLPEPGLEADAAVAAVEAAEAVEAVEAIETVAVVDLAETVAAVGVSETVAPPEPVESQADGPAETG